MSVLPPECNCKSIKLMDTPCPLHGYLSKSKDIMKDDCFLAEPILTE